jgi:hypothetical protein
MIDEISLGLAPVVFLRLMPVIKGIAASGVGVLLVEQFAHMALNAAMDALVVTGGRVSYQGNTATGVLIRAAGFFTECGIPKIERVVSDNAFAYRKSRAFNDAVADLGATQEFITPHCPWTNGKVERLNRTWPRSGPTGRSSPAISLATMLLRPGSTSTTPNASIPASEQPPSAECH